MVIKEKILEKNSDQYFPFGELPTLKKMRGVNSSIVTYKYEDKELSIYLLSSIYSPCVWRSSTMVYLYVTYKNKYKEYLNKKLGFIMEFDFIEDLYDMFSINNIIRIPLKMDIIKSISEKYYKANLKFIPNEYKYVIDHSKSLFKYEESTIKLLLKVEEEIKKIDKADLKNYGIRTLVNKGNINKNMILYNSWGSPREYNLYTSDIPKLEFEKLLYQLPGTCCFGLNYIFNYKQSFLDCMNVLLLLYPEYDEVLEINIVLIKGEYIEDGHDNFESILKDAKVVHYFKEKKASKGKKITQTF